MIETKRKGFIFLAAAFTAVLVLAQVAGSGAQTTPVPRPAGPPNKPCDHNGNCEPGETDFKTTRQWCPDCEPKTYPPLNILPFPQVVSRGAWDYPFSRDKVFYYSGTDSDGDMIGEYRVSWASATFDSAVKGVCAADVDNDGAKEIIAGSSVYSHKEGKGNKAVSYYYAQFSIFESGSTGEPAWTSPNYELGPGSVSKIQAGDVDADGRTEVVIIKRRHVSVYEISFSGGTYSCIQEYPGFCPDYDSIVFSFHIGDADNCGLVEIVLAMFDVGAPIIWKFDPTSQSWSSKTAEPVPPEYWNPKFSDPWIAIDTARVRDVDNLPGNEIISGGNSNRLIIWKHDPDTGDYNIVFISGDLGGFTQGVDAGDIDGDGTSEIVVGDDGGVSGAEKIHIFKYQDGDYAEVYSLNARCLGFLRVGDIDQDGRAEIVADHSVMIYEWIGNGLVPTYAIAWGYGVEID